jgi:hypothetical protein
MFWKEMAVSGGLEGPGRVKVDRRGLDWSESNRIAASAWPKSDATWRQRLQDAVGGS